MLAKAWQQLRERPFAGVAVSLAIHLAILAALLWVGGPASIYTVKRGEPLFVELPQVDEPAQRGAPPAHRQGEGRGGPLFAELPQGDEPAQRGAPASEKPAPPAPKVQPTPPAPRGAAPPPKPASPPAPPH